MTTKSKRKYNWRTRVLKLVLKSGKGVAGSGGVVIERVIRLVGEKKKLLEVGQMLRG